MTTSRIQLRFAVGAAAIALAIGACGPLGTAAASPTLTVIPSPSAGPSATPEIVSPTAIPVTATASPPASTETPAASPSVTAAPQPQSACAPPQVPPALMGSLKWVAYCDTRYGFGFRYPTTGGDSYAGNGRLYLPYLLGTNLHEKWLDVTVSEGAATCSSPQTDGYAPGTVPTENVSFNGIPFVKESGEDAGAGNFYQWEAYSTLQGSLCVSMTFTLHSVNRLNYDTPPPEFDLAAESGVFGTIMSTFDWFTP